MEKEQYVAPQLQKEEPLQDITAGDKVFDGYGSCPPIGYTCS